MYPDIEYICSNDKILTRFGSHDCCIVTDTKDDTRRRPTTTVKKAMDNFEFVQGQCAGTGVEPR
jgi:hypothetical protein